LKPLQRRKEQNNLLKTQQQAKINLLQMRNNLQMRNRDNLQMRNNKIRKTWIPIPPLFSLTL
jgi:hypothetical protein